VTLVPRRRLSPRLCAYRRGQAELRARACHALPLQSRCFGNRPTGAG
jgi:hypothetical protein